MHFTSTIITIKLKKKTANDLIFLIPNGILKKNMAVFWNHCPCNNSKDSKASNWNSQFRMPSSSHSTCQNWWPSASIIAVAAGAGWRGEKIAPRAKWFIGGRSRFARTAAPRTRTLGQGHCQVKVTVRPALLPKLFRQAEVLHRWHFTLLQELVKGCSTWFFCEGCQHASTKRRRTLPS